MNTIQLDEQRFKKMARRLSISLKKPGVSLSHQACLQHLSQALFGKLYDEVKPTLLNATKSAEQSGTVVILSYAEQHVLMVNGEFVCATNPGTDLAITYQSLSSASSRFAKQYDTVVLEIALPLVALGDGQGGYSDDDIVELAKKMGYDKPYNSIFECLQHMEAARIDGRTTAEPLVSDAFELLQDQDPDEQILWMPEIAEDDGVYEYFFSFADLCKATTLDGKTWKVPNGTVFCAVTFLF